MARRKRNSGPRVYVAALAAYNEGKLHGAWIDADQDEEDIERDIQAMLASSPVPGEEEWAIHDFEGFGNLSLGENESLETVSAIGRLIAEHGEGPVAAAYNYGNHDPDDLSRCLEDSYRGHYASETAFAEEMLDDTGQLDELPEWARPYFDFEAFGRDLFMGDYWSADGDGGIYVFDATSSNPRRRGRRSSKR